LAEALGVQLRTMVLLDWDHVWSEVAFPPTHAEVAFPPSGAGGASPLWLPPTDPDARNFAARLDEGIGAWTRVLGVSFDPRGCGCDTEEYLRCAAAGGRIDVAHAARLGEYRRLVHGARADPSGSSSQAGTLNGYVLAGAGFSDQQVTDVMARAAAQHGAAPPGEPFPRWRVEEADVPAG